MSEAAVHIIAAIFLLIGLAGYRNDRARSRRSGRFAGSQNRL